MIALLFTGGTISMKLDPATGAAVPALGAADIVAQVPELADDRGLRGRGLRAAPRPARHARAHVAARAAARPPGSSGRTSTASSSRTARTRSRRRRSCSISAASDKPVVLVGAMRTVSDRELGRARQPAHRRARSRVTRGAAAYGVLVVDGRADLSRRAKSARFHTESSGAFADARIRTARRRRRRARSCSGDGLLPRPAWQRSPRPSRACACGASRRAWISCRPTRA